MSIVAQRSHQHKEAKHLRRQNGSSIDAIDRPPALCRNASTLLVLMLVVMVIMDVGTGIGIEYRFDRVAFGCLACILKCVNLIESRQVGMLLARIVVRPQHAVVGNAHG